ncbi:hypothetical protein [Actinophytocola sp.]|uniref:hypothetical protein n=1 Tax=Actinophytocola sp. TaxID=1872138 RepID=UPI002ED47879
MEDRQTFSRASTARALVLLASALAVGGSALLCLMSVVFAERIVLATAVFAAFALVGAVVGTLLTIRAKSVGKVVGLGCGTLLVTLVLGLAIMLILISDTGGNPT